MAAISETIAPSAAKKHLRPFDVRRDLGEVADLVELCFADTLDPDGRDYLRRMRSAANSSSLLGMAQGWSSAPMTGFVWEENERIVGNLSLIPYFLKARRCFLIANVAVHPNYRRAGIARQMTDAGIRYARERHAPAIWLHVREHNEAALGLYRSLGFAQRAVRTTWHANPDPATAETPAGLRFITPGKGNWPQVRAWLDESYPPELTWHMPFHLNSLRPGILGTIARMAYNTYVRQWGAVQAGRLRAAAVWQATGSSSNVLWLAAPEGGDPLVVQALLEHILKRAPTRRGLLLEFPARRFDQAIRQAGFTEQQTLVWMELGLN